jgi:hypothetical protein
MLKKERQDGFDGANFKQITEATKPAETILIVSIT